MEFKQLEAFVNVVRYKSFSKAADASFLTQPTVSTHIKSLEKELGVTLIDRMGKESLPTSEGRELYRYAVNMLNTRQQAAEVIGGMEDSAAGIINIQSSSIPGNYLLPEIMSAFHEKYPMVRFYTEVTDSENVRKSILEGTGEIGFTGEVRKEGLDAKLLYTDEVALIVPATERYRKIREKTDRISVKDIAGEPFIWREEGSATRMTFEEKATKLIGKRLESVAVVNSLDAIMACVSAGLGVSVVSHLASRSVRAEKCLLFRLSDVSLQRKFYVISSKDVSLSPTAEKFRSFALHYFKNE